MPKKLKLLIVNYLRFSGIYFIISMIVEVGCQYGAWPHPGLIKLGMYGIFFSVSGLFAWRFYTGMYRD